MKRGVSLTALLDGNSKKKKLNRLPINPADPLVTEYDFNANYQAAANRQRNEDTVSSIDISEELISSPVASSQRTLAGKEQQSVQSLLMGRKNKRKVLPLDDTESPVVISLDKDDMSDEVDDESTIIDIGEESLQLTLPRESTVSYPSNSKRTTLKELLKNLKQNEAKPIVLNSATVSGNFEPDSKKYGRSKDTQDPKRSKGYRAPFPSQQLVAFDDDSSPLRNLEIPLKKKKAISKVKVPFQPSDYVSLNGKSNIIVDTIYTRIATHNKKHTSLWPQLLKPKSLEDVLLDPILKKNTKQWIANAFVKLKKPTTRNKLLKRQRLDGKDPIDDFIVNDGFENGDAESKDFVPILVLFGEGIGKNTLLEVIMEELEGQIYEINTSANRSKKEILDNLTEFSTTHYVKGKGSKGIILLDDVDILFREHDKFFWQALEKILLGSRRPIVLLCRNINYVPSNIVQLAHDENSLFQAKRVSHKTVIQFLERYCQILGLEINHSILELLVKCHKKDIRKCLMELQFSCTPPGQFPIQNEMSKDAIDSDISSVSFYADILSASTVIEEITQWKSFIPQGVDSTLMSPYAISKLNQLSDDRDRLKNDYIIDYRLHLIDKINHQMMPFELNIGTNVVSELKERALFKHTPYNLKTNFSKMTKATAAYLSTRVNFQNHGTETKVRKTRNSRKFQEILDRFDGKVSTSPVDDIVEFELDMMLNENVKAQINPFVYEIAKSDALVKATNKEIFLTNSDGAPKTQHNEIVYQLILQGLIKPIWFRADPKVVIDSWK